MVDSLGDINFPIDVDPQAIYQALQAGRFGSAKAVFRRFVYAVQQSGGTPQPEHFALQFARAQQAMRGEWAQAAQSPATPRLSGKIELSVPSGGFERNEVRRLLLTFGRAKSVRLIPFAMLIYLFDDKSRG